MNCNRCGKNNVPIEKIGFFCDDCDKIRHEEWNNRTFEHTCFQCGQNGGVVEAVWKAYGWAVTYGQAGTTHHCNDHKPVDSPKIQPENQGHGFKCERIENNKRKELTIE